MELACNLARKGGLVLAPSGPGMAGDLTSSKEYQASLEGADITLLDSGLIALWSKVIMSRKLSRISGLAFLNEFLLKVDWEREKALWVMPSDQQAKGNLDWLSRRFCRSFEQASTYIAPQYPKFGRIEDQRLAEMISLEKPKNVFVQLGGGVQERLGMYLKDKADSSTTIICTGAALAFLSGQQVRIPMWIDRLYLGWLFRCIWRPQTFGPRYFKALKLIYLLFRYGKKTPS